MKNVSAERRGCPYCRNFLARSTVHPEGFRILLDQRGVDPEKEGEVYEGLIEGPLVGCGGWFYLAGELVEAGERMTDAGIAFQCFFRRSHKPTTLADFGDEVLALEFSTRLPWVVSEEPEWPVKTDG